MKKLIYLLALSAMFVGCKDSNSKKQATCGDSGKEKSEIVEII